MPLPIFIALAGGVAGFLSGLLGIGGGIIMVPLLFFIFPRWGLPQETAIPLALGTSLAAATCFTLSGALGHWKRGTIDWARVPWLVAGGVVGAVVGSSLALWVGGPVVKKAFAFLLLFAFYRMTLSPVKEKGGKAPPRGRWSFLVIGLATGLVSAFFGVGGGIVAVSLMVLVFRFPILEAVATSSAIIPAIAGTGALSYVIHGWGKPGLPPWSLGYVNMLAWGLLVSVGVVASQVGVWVGHRVEGAKLRRVFGVLLLFVAVKLILG